MICPRCHSEFDIPRAACPECGVRLLQSVGGVMKTSAVMIAAGGERGFYRSVQDVPEPLRTQLIAITTSPNSGTIIIADRAGKQQLTQALARHTSFTGRRPAAPNAPEAALPRPHNPPPRRRDFSNVSWLAWAGLLLVLTLSGVVAFLFGMRW